MTNFSNIEGFVNFDSPFTELFGLLKSCKKIPSGSLMMNPDDLQIMRQHVENAMDILLQGLQDLGQILGLSNNENQKLNYIDFFMAAVLNLIEALNQLRKDIEYWLHKTKFSLR